METSSRTKITIETTVNAPIEKVWELWSNPNHVTQWNSASDDWHTPAATNDLKVDGRFSFTMAAKDGSASFDFGGVYTKLETNKLIEYTLDDERKVSIQFSGDEQVEITETFEAEGINSIEMQRSGWQAILDNFKKYAETNK
ncbi:MAG: SRPBCC family protein [Cyclobacteriaceae bacterium]